MNPNPLPSRRARALAHRTPETEAEMWRAYLIATGMALALVAVWVALVSFAA